MRLVRARLFIACDIYSYSRVRTKAVLSYLYHFIAALIKHHIPLYPVTILIVKYNDIPFEEHFPVLSHVHGTAIFAGRTVVLDLRFGERQAYVIPDINCRALSSRGEIMDLYVCQRGRTASDIYGAAISILDMSMTIKLKIVDAHGAACVECQQRAVSTAHEMRMLSFIGEGIRALNCQACYRLICELKARIERVVFVFFQQGLYDHFPIQGIRVIKSSAMIIVRESIEIFPLGPVFASFRLILDPDDGRLVSYFDGIPPCQFRRHSRTADVIVSIQDFVLVHHPFR